MNKFEKDTRNRLLKSERLSSGTLIKLLFSKGRSFAIEPFVVRYIPIPENDGKYHQMMVSVSKRNFKKAVDRNRIKRRIREAYRLNKEIIADLPTKYAIAYIYTFKKMIPYKDIEAKLIDCLSRLNSELIKINEN